MMNERNSTPAQPGDQRMESRGKILIVEDEALIGLMLAAHFKKIGFDVYSPASSGEEALRLIEHEHPGLILMDIHLAGKMDGIEAARLALLQGEFPIIFITGYTNPEMTARMNACKPLACLTKPLQIGKLVEIITQWQRGGA